MIAFIDERALKRSHDLFLKAVTKAMDDAAEFAAEHARQHVQQYPGFRPRTGRLQQSTKVQFARTASGRIVRMTNARKYAGAIEYGARAHTIAARRRRALRFRGRDGTIIFRRVVHHPGNRPFKFGWRAMYAAYRVMQRFAETELDRAAIRRF